jgi:hypothetical protein
MHEITLYTHERAGAGLTNTNVCRVKGAVRLQVVSENEIRDYPAKGGGPSETKHAEISPHTGKADLRLQTAEGEIDLAKCKWAVGLVVSGWNGTTIYWIGDGLCSHVEPVSMAGLARAKIEARYCPEEVELPPPITCAG